MTPLTTTDDDSSTIASTHLHQQPRIPRSRQVSKNGSLASSITSPPSTYPHSDLSSQLNTLSLQNDAPVYPQHHRQSSSIYRGDDGKDSKMETSSIRSTKSGAVSISASTIASTAMTSPSAGNGDQLRVRHLEPGASHTGYLTKFSSRTFFSRKQWKRRYFVLNQRSLYCFKSSDPQHPLLETLNLCAETIVCVTDIFSGKRYCLQITSPGEKNWYVLADTANELSGWLRQLKGTVLRCRNPQQAMNQDPLYQYQQQQLESSRPRTHYSDSSEWSDLSSAASYGLMENEGGAIATRRGSSSSSTFSVNSGRRVSVVVDRPEAMITLPRRSSQRLMGSPSRPMSPVLSRPMSPNANRPSPRSSLVVAPPPRSIHRPASVSVRYSAQMISSLQIATQNLQQSIKTAEQHQRPMSPLDSPQRPGSRLSHLRFPSNVGLIHDRSPNGLGLGRVSMDRPLTPISATLASPPTSPLPEPPRPGSISPVRALRHSLSNSSSSSHRISIVPRHHDPDLLVSHRASPRSRAQSQESALVSRSHDKHFMQPQQQQQYNSHHASSPLPSFPGAIALDETSTDLDHDGQDAVLRKHISLPVSNKMALPPPPKIQQPDASAYHQYQHNTFPRQHKHSSSNASVSSMSSQTSSIHSFPAGVASFGGAIARKNNSRDSALSIRLSTLVPIPVGSVSSVPLPPQTALPPIPGSVVPSPSTSPLPTPPTSGKLEVVVPVSAGNEDGIATAAAALLAVPLSDLPTPPTSLTLALPTQLADVEEKEQQPCMTMPTAPAQDEATVENIVIDRQVDTVGVQSKVEPLSEEIVTPDAAAVEEEKEEERPHNPSWSMASEMILEEAEKADVSLIGAKDVVSVAASTTTATTTTVTTTTTNSTPTKDQLEEQEERQKEDVVASLAIESASPSLSS
ncbi:hypothetical protein BGW39_006232 [Mortierella sp. 14UC]|nr:hypothetical protein BGW39_006232 [Mortierella sp. 14UC]